MLKKVLIANRGEIALRVVRACRELGIGSVAVYSDVDRAAPHVLAADEAYPIGPAPSAESYLRIDRLLEVARASGCDAVHPGYGFLAERAPFATAVQEAGLVFVGPSPEAIRAMGDKTEARRRMMAAGVPVVPGTVEPLPDADAGLRTAETVGYPILLKAAAGGGGKGMRVVRAPEDVLFMDVHTIPHAYVLYDDQYGPARQEIVDWLRGCDILTAGRYGRWEYSSMEDALLAGRECARKTS